MKEQSQTPDLAERELVPEREYQRVTISGEEKCGVRGLEHDVFLSFIPVVLLLTISQQHLLCSSLCGCDSIVPASRFPSQTCWTLPNVW